MAVGPVTLNGVIQRTQDVGMLRQHEEAKPFVDQQNIQANLKEQETKLTQQVNHADDADEHKKKYDAKEKGSNEYEGQQGKKKKSEKKEPGKNISGSERGHFDIKV